jgi:cbb3-type cytochrome oxidase cytochrome c subunit
MAGGPPGPGGWGPRGKGGRRAPDLGKVGRDPAHTAEWLAAYVRDPKSQKPDSGMPPYDGKINDSDLRALAQYLANLK